MIKRINMLESKLKLSLLLLILFLFGCGKEQPLNVEEVLTSGTWIKHSQLSDETVGFEEFFMKDEYNFIENGKYTISSLVVYLNENFEPVAEIVVFEDDWSYIKKTSIIDFKVNDNPPENTIVMQFDWKILEISNTKIIVEPIFPVQPTPILWRLMLVKK